MIKNFSEISGDFEIEKLRNNKRVAVFLICLLISTVLWFLNALSKDYTTSVNYPVKFTNPPKNQFLSGGAPAELNLTVQGKGFALLQHKLLTFSPVEIDISGIIQQTEPSSGSYKILSRNLMGTISTQVASDIIISEIKPELLVIVLDSLSTKTVPVEIDLNVDFVSQMHLKNKVTTNPDKVEITGPSIVLDNISAVKTKVNITNKLNASIQQEIDLIHPEKTTIVPEKVTINIEVEKYTEKELKVPVEIFNKPADVQLKLFPSEIKLFCSVGLSRFDSIKASDFGVAVDYNSIINDVNSLGLTIFKQPELVQNIKLNPEKVEFLIENNK
ncbi:MAG: YbbR-like domain-containing protein [Draconibacterium sp.]